VAWALLGCLVLVSIAGVWMKDRAELFQRLKPSKSPDALAEQARTFIKQFGYLEEPADSEVALQPDSGFVDFQNGQDTRAFSIPWDNLSSLSPVFFLYRQSPRPLEHSSLWLHVFSVGTDPPVLFSGEVVVKLDTEGRLRSLRAIPPAIVTFAPQTNSSDWAMLFSAAGLDIGAWRPTDPRWNPESYADTKAAWEGSLPDVPNVPIRIEAAAYQGKPVSFNVIYPWTRQERMAQTASNFYSKALTILGTVMFVIILAGPVFFARQNLRLGRGDRRGANRMVIALVLVPFTVASILLDHHVSTSWEVEVFIRALARTMLAGGLVWTLYIAIEPFVRRRWPQMLISWTRLLSGEWRDPVVGRDVLIGCLAGVTQWSLALFSVLLSSWSGRPQTALMTSVTLNFVMGTSSFIGQHAFLLFSSVTIGLAATFLFVLLRTLLRKEWLATAIFIVVLTTPDSSQFSAAGPWFSFGANLVASVIILFTLMRFGLVALAALCVCTGIFGFSAITFQYSWFTGYGYASLLLIAALAFYGFKTSLGGRPVLSFSSIDGEPGPRSTIS
jgi:serine/threonine-protein kinase